MYQDLGRFEEEFTNFMHRVTEVNKIVTKLNSQDENLQNIGLLEADQYLKDSDQTTVEKIDEKNVVLKVKSDRTIINKKALLKQDNPDTMSQGRLLRISCVILIKFRVSIAEAFMEEVSKDAEMRYKDKLVRREKMETFKKQASLAFRRGEYERALTCYNKVNSLHF